MDKSIVLVFDENHNARFISTYQTRTMNPFFDSLNEMKIGNKIDLIYDNPDDRSIHNFKLKDVSFVSINKFNKSYNGFTIKIYHFYYIPLKNIEEYIEIGRIKFFSDTGNWRPIVKGRNWKELLFTVLK